MRYKTATERKRFLKGARSVSKRPAQPDNTTPQDWMMRAERDCEATDQLLNSMGSRRLLRNPGPRKGLKSLGEKADDPQRPKRSHLRGARTVLLGQLESGGELANEHWLLKLVELLRPWHQDNFDRFHADLDWIDNNKLYERLRYPTAVVQGATFATPLVFGKAEAHRLRELAEELLAVVRSRL
jgi:hypothetical protein